MLQHALYRMHRARLHEHSLIGMVLSCVSFPIASTHVSGPVVLHHAVIPNTHWKASEVVATVAWL